MDDGYWFRPKSYGLGAVPDSWQGWTVTLVFGVLLLAVMLFMPDPGRPIVAVAIVLAFMLLCWRKTRGGWHWHWGRPKD